MLPQLPEVPAVTAEEADQLIADGALLVDCREQNEWDAARIPGADLKPMSTINDWYESLPRDRKIVFQCRTGARSAQIVHALITQAGFDNVINLTGGIVAWAAADLPVDTATP